MTTATLFKQLLKANKTNALMKQFKYEYLSKIDIQYCIEHAENPIAEYVSYRDYANAKRDTDFAMFFFVEQHNLNIIAMSGRVSEQYACNHDLDHLEYYADYNMSAYNKHCHVIVKVDLFELIRCRSEKTTRPYNINWAYETKKRTRYKTLHELKYLNAIEYAYEDCTIANLTIDAIVEHLRSCIDKMLEYLHNKNIMHKVENYVIKLDDLEFEHFRKSSTCSGFILYFDFHARYSYIIKDSTEKYVKYASSMHAQRYYTGAATYQDAINYAVYRHLRNVALIFGSAIISNNMHIELGNYANNGFKLQISKEKYPKLHTMLTTVFKSIDKRF